MPPRVNYGTTWWGSAWVRALEGAASLDPNRLARGRTYARQGAVGALGIASGHASARVTGHHGRYYRVDIGVRKLAPAEWEQVADAIAARAAHAAALLEGELDPAIVDDTMAVDVRLLPGAGDLRTDCSCPDWAEPCKHSAAVCYMVAAELDRDPFVLFLLRGIARDELMRLVRERRLERAPAGARRTGKANAAGRSGAEGGDAPADGLPAAAAWRDAPANGALAPLPEVVRGREPLTASHRPAHTPWDADLPRGQKIDTRRVDELAVDAISRARDMLLDGAPSGLRSGSRADLARRAASLGRGPELIELASNAGVAPDALREWAAAWSLAGDPGVAVVADGDAWSTDQEALEAGRAALVEMGHLRRRIALSYDSLRTAGIWLVIGPDGRWYALRGQGKHQELHLLAPPSTDICDLVEPPPAP